MHRACRVLAAVLILVVGNWADIVFKVQPRSQAVQLNQALLLNCQAEDVPQNRPLVVQWVFNDSAVLESLPQASVFSNGSLYVPAISTDELGTYACIVQIDGEPGTSAESSEVTVVEAYLEPFILHPDSVEVAEGNSTGLDCVTGYSSPPPILTWERDGATYVGGQQSTGQFGVTIEGGAEQRTSHLDLTDVTELTSGGVYKCVARNSLTGQSISSNEATVTVIRPNEAPVIIQPPQPGYATEGQKFLLNCSFTGYPTPKVIWYQGQSGEVIKSDSSLSILANGSLYFSVMKREKQDIYWCNVTNEFWVSGI